MNVEMEISWNVLRLIVAYNLIGICLFDWIYNCFTWSICSIYVASMIRVMILSYLLNIQYIYTIVYSVLCDRYGLKPHTIDDTAKISKVTSHLANLRQSALLNGSLTSTLCRKTNIATLQSKIKQLEKQVTPLDNSNERQCSSNKPQQKSKWKGQHDGSSCGGNLKFMETEGVNDKYDNDSNNNNNSMPNDGGNDGGNHTNYNNHLNSSQMNENSNMFENEGQPQSSSIVVANGLANDMRNNNNDGNNGNGNKNVNNGEEKENDMMTGNGNNSHHNMRIIVNTITII